MHLSVQQKLKLVEVLLACPSMQDRQLRETIVRDLQDDIKNNIKHVDTARPDVMNIVSTALNYTNGLESLIQLVRFYESNSLGAQTVNEMYLRLQLVAVIQEENVATKVFSSIFRSWRILPVDSGHSFQSPETLVEDLWDLNSSLDPWHRLFLFTERLARRVNKAATVERLRKWAENAFSIVGSKLAFATLHDIHEAIKEQNEQPDQRPTYLTVEITPDFIDSAHVTTKLYQVQILFWRGNEQESTWRTGDEPAVALEKVPEEIAKALRENMNAWEATELTIEFLLPNELLLCDVDQWENKLKKTKGARLGMEYPIVVRSLQRIKMRESWRNWRQKWDAFNQYAHQQRLLHTFWLCVCEEADWQIFQTHAQTHCLEYTFRLRPSEQNWPIMLHNRLIGTMTATCLGMVFAPTEKPSEEDELFTALIESGIPTAFWLRPSPYASEPPTNIQTRLQQILGDCSLKTLPQALHRARQQGMDDSVLDLSNHLTLLWDDPDRIPAQYKDQPRTKNKRRLRAPQPAQPGRRVS
jgi:hypothetical protein